MANMVGSESPLFLSNTNGEAILYSILEKANLTQYFQEFISQGGDDMKQLCDANESEFLEIMVLVGMASKPLHVRRLQKVLIEWSNNPEAFQPSPNTPAVRNNNHYYNSYNKFLHAYNRSCALKSILSSRKAHNKHNNFNNNIFKNTINTFNNNTNNLISKIPTNNNMLSLDLTTKNIYNGLHENENSSHGGDNQLKVYLTSPNKNNHTSLLSQGLFGGPSSQMVSNFHNHHIQLSDTHIERLTLLASSTAQELPNYAPKPLNMKKPIDRLIDEAMNMEVNDPERVDLFRKYGAIYGRFDSKRSKDKQLNFHELCVNEAAAQLCLHRPSLLTRREELFLLARQVVKESGFHWNKSSKFKENTSMGGGQGTMTTDESQISIKQETVEDNEYNAANNNTPGNSFPNQIDAWSSNPVAPLIDNNNNDNNSYFNNSNNNNNGMIDGALNEMGSRSEIAGRSGDAYSVDNGNKDFNNKSEHSSSNNTTNNEFDEDDDEFDEEVRKQKRPRLNILTDNMNKNNTNNNVDYDLNDDGAGGDEENNGFIASNNLPNPPHGNI